MWTGGAGGYFGRIRYFHWCIKAIELVAKGAMRGQLPRTGETYKHRRGTAGGQGVSAGLDWKVRRDTGKGNQRTGRLGNRGRGEVGEAPGAQDRAHRKRGMNPQSLPVIRFFPIPQSVEPRRAAMEVLGYTFQFQGAFPYGDKVYLGQCHLRARGSYS